MRDYNPVYSVLHLDLWDRKCCFVICIVIVNAILVVERRIDRSATGGFNFSNSTRKHLCQSVFFKRLCCRFFPVNFPKFVRPLFLQNPFGRLLLYLEPCQISMIELFCGNTEAVAQRSSLKKVFRKRDSNPGTSVFLWILRNI